MGIFHVPRVAASITRGYMQRGKQTHVLGIRDPHVYKARAGILDYFMHLNNASFLSHAELARWEMTASTGLFSSQIQTALLVVSCAVRYRQEISPLFRQFQVDTTLATIDDRSMWFVHHFRYPEVGNDRTRAQVIVRCIPLTRGKAREPRQLLLEHSDYDKSEIESVHKQGRHEEHESLHLAVLDRYSDLETAVRDMSVSDDESRKL